MAYSIERMPERISIGRQTETGVTDVMIDCGAWVDKWPGMALHAIYTPEGGAPYILQTETDGGVLVWHVTDADTATPGTGLVEIVGETDGRRKVSAMVKVSVAARMSGTVGEPPEAAKPWVESVIGAADRITGMKAQAETLDAGSGATAAWDGEQGLLTIGVPKGEQGPKGEKGEKGPQGEKGEPGKDAVVDATLTQSGQAADAKATGDALALKLTEPSTGLAVGKYFRIADIDDSGHAVLEAVDAAQIGVQDVQVDGESIVTDGVASVSKYDTVKAAMCDGKGEAWTADEQTAARERMGIPGNFELIEEIICDGNASAYTRSVQPDGIPYRFISVFIELEIQKGNTYPVTFFRAYDGNDNAVLYDGKQTQSKNYVSYLVDGCDGYNGYYHGWMINQNVASSRDGGSNVKYSNAPTLIETPIMKVYVNTSIAFNSGDKIRIYGVRT